MSNSFSDNELDSLFNNSMEMIEKFYGFMTIFACQIEETIKELHNSMISNENLKEKEGVYDPNKKLSDTNIYDLCRYGYKTGLVFYKITRELEEGNPLRLNYYESLGFSTNFTHSKYPNVTVMGADKLLKKYGLKYPNHYFYGEMNEVIYFSQETISNEHLLLQLKIEEMFKSGIITKLETDILLLTIDYYASIVEYDFEIESRKGNTKKTLTK